MRRLLFLALVAGASVAALPATPRATPPKVGQQAPAFTLRDQNSRRVSVGEAGGAKVVLVFYRGYW